MGAWLRAEALTWAAGLGTGLLLAGGLLYADARADVDAWLTAPHSSAVSTVWSAPPLVRRGEPYASGELARDLLAAGYERLGEANRPDSFAQRGDTFIIQRARHDGPGFVIPEGQARITLANGHVSATSPSEGVSLRPIPLATVGDLETQRSPVTLDEVSPWMVPALLAIEDTRFHDHVGIDPVGITRALLRNLTTGDLQGGSTLTQQLAKNLFLEPERTVRRKVREVFVAAALEARLDKQELLELYLSEVYLGHQGGVALHGVEQAARAWFGKSAAHLSVGEAATIAGVIASPNVYSPLRGHEAAIERRDRVLERMVYVRALTEGQAKAARDEPLATLGAGLSAAWRAPWLVDAALDEVSSALGPGAVDSGLQVHTHVQLHLQRAAQAALSNGLARLEAEHDEAVGAEGAVAVVRARDGAVLALVGGRDFIRSPFHRAVDAWRQGGSTIKPFTALGALDRVPGVTPATVLTDAPISRRFDGQTWSPRNYDGVYLGPVSVRRMIEASRNVPAVLLSERLGLARQRVVLDDLGLSRATSLPSSALGAFPLTPLELAGAYTVFPGSGRARRPRVLRLVTDEDGQVLHSVPERSEVVAGPVATALTRRLLEGVMVEGTARSAGLRGAFGGKTGTTDRGRDAWFAGFDPELAVVVWVGKDRAVLDMTGGQAALPIWADFVRDVGMPRGRFTDPPGIVSKSICIATGAPPCPGCGATRTEWFAADGVPETTCEAEVAAASEPE